MPKLPYTVRESAQAKRVLLKIRPGRGLEVVVPTGFDTSRVPRILKRKQPWIDRTCKRLEAQGFTLHEPLELPHRIDLPAAHLAFALRLEPGTSAPRLRREAGVLILSGDCSDPEAACAPLRDWLKALGRDRLPAMLAQCAHQCGLEQDGALPYRRVQVRGQRSRWGSCSAKGTISLNCKLLLLPEDLCRHVLLHELCHTSHLDHSEKFWNLMHALEPDCEEQHKRLQRAWGHLPRWAG
jgi:hypothetical protein